MSTRRPASFFDRLGGAQSFRDEFWETTWGRFPDCFGLEEIEAIVPLALIDRHVMSGGLRSPDLQIISHGRAVDVPLTPSFAPATDTAFLLNAYKSGHGFRIQHLENYLPELAAWCTKLEREIGSPLRANAYFSPPNSIGLAPHYDGCDSFVVQILGKKNWQMFSEYTENIALPTPEQRFSPAKHRPLGESRGATMCAGDVLYIPRGVMHAAFTQLVPSIHVTLSVLGPTWADILMQIIQAEALENEALRRLAPLSGIGGLSLQKLSEQAREHLGLIDIPQRIGGTIRHVDERIENHKPRASAGSLLSLWQRS